MATNVSIHTSIKETLFHKKLKPEHIVLVKSLKIGEDKEVPAGITLEDPCEGSEENYAAVGNGHCGVDFVGASMDFSLVIPHDAEFAGQLLSLVDEGVELPVELDFIVYEYVPGEKKYMKLLEPKDGPIHGLIKKPTGGSAELNIDKDLAVDLSESTEESGGLFSSSSNDNTTKGTYMGLRMSIQPPTVAGTNKDKVSQPIAQNFGGDALKTKKWSKVQVGVAA